MGRQSRGSSPGFRPSGRPLSPGAVRNAGLMDQVPRRYPGGAFRTLVPGGDVLCPGGRRADASRCRVPCQTGLINHQTGRAQGRPARRRKEVSVMFERTSIGLDVHAPLGVGFRHSTVSPAKCSTENCPRISWRSGTGSGPVPARPGEGCLRGQSDRVHTREGPAGHFVLR